MKKVDPNRLLRLADGWELRAKKQLEPFPPWWKPFARTDVVVRAAILRICAESLRHEVREDQRKGKA